MTVLIGMVEASLIAVGSVLGPLVYARVTGISVNAIGDTLAIGLLSSVFYVTIATSAGLYSLRCLVEPGGHLRRLLAVCCTVVMGLTAVLFLFKIGSEVSRGAVVGFSVCMLVLCALARAGAAEAIDAMLSHGAILGVPACLIGDAAELAALTPAALLRQFGLYEVGRVTLDGAEATQVGLAARVRHGLQVARAQAADELIVAVRWDDGPRLAAIEDVIRTSPLPARLLPSADQRALVARLSPAGRGDIHMLDLQRAPMGLAERAAKRALDIAGAIAGLVLLMPVLALSAAMIKLGSPGPVLFRQVRNGFDRRPFTIFKLRTMRAEDGDAVRQAQRNDGRVTRVGRVLRRSSIDEIPQLVNVLLGQMSLVGPRPHALAHDRDYAALIDNYCLRHHAKPGLTGWAQINGHRGETAAPEAMKRRIDCDVWYVRNRSLLLDLRIIATTLITVLSHDAY